MHKLLQFWGPLTEFRQKPKNAGERLQLKQSIFETGRPSGSVTEQGRKELLGSHPDGYQMNQPYKVESIPLEGKAGMWQCKVFVKC